MIHFLLFTALLVPSSPPDLKQWLANNQWQHRLVLVYAPTDSDPDLKRQRALLATASAGLAERDLLVRELLADQLPDEDRAFLAQTLRITGSTFRVLLIGKDGGVKTRQTSPITPKQLFDTIDGMYMRQQEMKNRRSKS